MALPETPCQAGGLGVAAPQAGGLGVAAPRKIGVGFIIRKMMLRDKLDIKLFHSAINMIVSAAKWLLD